MNRNNPWRARLSQSGLRETLPGDVSVKTQRLQLKCDEKQQEGGKLMFVYCHSDLVLLLDLAVRWHNRQVKLDATVFLKYQPRVGIWIQSGRPARFKQSYIKRESEKPLSALTFLKLVAPTRCSGNLSSSEYLERHSLFKNQVTTMGRCTVLQLWCNHCYFIIRAYQSCCVKL